MNTLNNKIISRFYVITLNKKPVYVGYTNRPIEQRFNEHKRDKDFGKIQPEIEQIAQLEYEFTWDTNKIDRYANEVNNKECELIQQFNTQNSKYQKANGGGQNWADIKYFVNTNHNNPKFLNMPESDVLKRIETEHNINKYLMGFQQVNTNVSLYLQSFTKHIYNPPTRYLIDFTYHMKNPTSQYLKSFVTNMHTPIVIYIQSYISSMVDPTSQYMQNFIHTMHTPANIYIKNYIDDMTNPATKYMSHFSNNMNNPATIYIKNCIGHMNNPATEYINNCIGRMNNPATRYINDCIKHMNNPATIYINSYIGSMDKPLSQYMKNFINNMH